MQIILYQASAMQADTSSLVQLLSNATGQSHTQATDLPSPQISDLIWDCPKALSEAECYELLRSALPYVRAGGYALYLRQSGAKPIRRIVADLDGCLVAEELLVKLSEGETFAHELSTATQAAMQGEVPFAENFSQRIAYLRGKRATDLESIAYQMTLAPGAELLTYFVEGEDIRFDIASSNLIPYVHHLSLRLNAHEYIATMPSMDENEILDGTLIAPIVSGAEKRTFALANPYERYPAEATLSIGDGANDLPMLSATGHALLYASTSPHSLNIAHLVADLYFR